MSSELKKEKKKRVSFERKLRLTKLFNLFFCSGGRNIRTLLLSLLFDGKRPEHLNPNFEDAENTNHPVFPSHASSKSQDRDDPSLPRNKAVDESMLSFLCVDNKLFWKNPAKHHNDDRKEDKVVALPRWKKIKPRPHKLSA
jgi:hypothetical protein